MEAPELRKDLHSQIDHLDEKTLEAVYAMFQDYFGGKNYELTQAHQDLIEERLADYEENPQKVISWGESNQLLKKYL
jgi:putative addiction module component (TIGR02574 family)